MTSVESRPPRRFAPPFARRCIARWILSVRVRAVVEPWRWWGLWVTARVVCEEPFGPWGRA